MIKQFGLVRVSAATTRVVVGNPAANADEILAVLGEVGDSDVVVFPELCVSSYTCGDLFHQDALLNETVEQTIRIAKDAPNPNQLVLVGAPVRAGSSLYNCAVAINQGRVIGIAPKQFIPNYNEFYEGRWFAAGDDSIPNELQFGENVVPFGTQLLFTHQLESNHAQVVVYVEVCEAIWMPIPPSSLAAVAGANILCNQSASNETIGKADYRRNLVVGQSGRCIAAYAYTSSGPTESTSDLVFGGHAMIAEAGHMMSESPRVGDGGELRRDSYWITSDVDVEKLQTERRVTTSFSESIRYLGGRQFRSIPFSLAYDTAGLRRTVDALPFVPKNEETLHQRCAEIFGIQTSSLAKRLEMLGKSPTMSIGVSGGLDSTLALLVAIKTCDVLKLPRSCIRAVTMPGFGTTVTTRTNAHDLMGHLGVESTEIDIRPAVLMEFKELAEAVGYQPFGQIRMTEEMTVTSFSERLQTVPIEQRQDLVFENVQARRRTELLMNMGFVLGTGDMSELWLGWCTYNADHQSMYNVNCSIPKTLVKFLVEYVAKTEFEGAVRETLMSIVNTEISPELLPPDENGEIAQSTEEKVGPYELHDFFMFNIVRHRFSPEKIMYLAGYAQGWHREYSHNEIAKWLRANVSRAFAQQYKRDDVPNGPKVGSVSLSPRGDWRMPSDADPAAWLRTLDD